jgi:flavorubredoxin
MESTDFRGIEINLESPTVLFKNGSHAVYWLGITDETAFRCNTYLIRDGTEAILVDPGGRTFFDQVRTRVAQVMAPEQITGMILCHQDPDVAASMVDWLDINPEMQVISTPRTHVLLPHYGKLDYPAYEVSEKAVFPLPSGSELRFIEAPFLHFPGAFTTYDTASGFLFSGDIWAALDMNWRLVVESFENHIPAMDLFHLDYMVSHIAARGFAQKLVGMDIRAILPQHGSLISTKHVPSAIDYLRTLRCGLDIIYAGMK